MNEDLINSAISFLKDPNVASSPLTKKVEFLESKGLNQQEIEEALKRVTERSSDGVSPSTNVPASSSVVANSPPMDYYNVSLPRLPERTWKDYFIMATATAGVTYGLYQVVTKYLVPSIIPPSQSSIEKDKAKVDEEFIKIDKILEQLSKDQEEIKVANETKLKDIDIVIDNVNDFLSKYNKDKLKFDDDLRLMKLEIDNLKNSIEKNMKFNKENIKEELQGINEELNSLKQLIKIRSEKSANDAIGSRKIAPVSSIPSASEILKKAKAKSDTKVETKAGLGALPVKPSVTSPSSLGGVTAAGIPEWQLQHKKQEEEKEQGQEEPAIPSWQLNATSTGQSDAIVNEAIKDVGVPSWQLNSTATDDKKKDDKNQSGIPSWQLNASNDNITT